MGVGRLGGLVQVTLNVPGVVSVAFRFVGGGGVLLAIVMVVVGLVVWLPAASVAWSVMVCGPSVSSSVLSVSVCALVLSGQGWGRVKSQGALYVAAGLSSTRRLIVCTPPPGSLAAAWIVRLPLVYWPGSLACWSRIYRSLLPHHPAGETAGRKQRGRRVVSAMGASPRQSSIWQVRPRRAHERR